VVVPFGTSEKGLPVWSGSTPFATTASLPNLPSWFVASRRYIAGLGGRYAEGFAAANDYEQAQGRVFQAAARIVEASPLLLRRLRGVRRTQPLPVVFKNCTIVARYLDPAHYLVR
jgi:hypothetical protein